MPEQKCCAQVYSGSPYFPYTCGRTAKVEREGKHYCGIHDPVHRAEKQQAKREAWDAEYEAKKKKLEKEKSEAVEQKRRADCFPDLLEACKKAEKWLEGWASAEPYIAELQAAIKKATQ